MFKTRIARVPNKTHASAWLSYSKRAPFAGGVRSKSWACTKLSAGLNGPRLIKSAFAEWETDIAERETDKKRMLTETNGLEILFSIGRPLTLYGKVWLRLYRYHFVLVLTRSLKFVLWPRNTELHCYILRLLMFVQWERCAIWADWPNFLFISTWAQPQERASKHCNSLNGVASEVLGHSLKILKCIFAIITTITILCFKREIVKIQVLILLYYNFYCCCCYYLYFNYDLLLLPLLLLSLHYNKHCFCCYYYFCCCCGSTATTITIIIIYNYHYNFSPTACRKASS